MALAALLARILLAAALLARAAYVVRWRRGRPDLVPRWLALKLVALDVAIAAAALATVVGSRVYVVALWISAAVATVIAVRLWGSRRWMTHPLAPSDAAREASRLAHDALDMANTVEKGGPDVQ